MVRPIPQYLADTKQLQHLPDIPDINKECLQTFSTSVVYGSLHWRGILPVALIAGIQLTTDIQQFHKINPNCPHRLLQSRSNNALV
jgi:hypothetical protein